MTHDANTVVMKTLLVDVNLDTVKGFVSAYKYLCCGDGRRRLFLSLKVMAISLVFDFHTLASMWL